MRSKFYTNRVFLSLIVTFIICLIGISPYTSAMSVTHSLKSHKGETTSNVEASQLRIYGDAIIEIASFEPCPNCIRRHPLFLHFPIHLDFPVSAFNTIDINQLSLIRKDNLFLSIWRI